VRRRDFIKAITASAAAWPLAARAQQSAMPVIAFLRSTSAAGSEHLVAAFEQGLKEAGFVAGQNVAIDYRWGNDQLDRLPGLVADLIRRQPAVIIGNIQATRAIMAATTTIPIVFVGSAIRLEPASSPVSTIQAATSQARSLPLLIWPPSGWGCCTTWFPSQSPSPRCFIRPRREPTSIWRRWRRPVKRLAGKS
jgi:ABC-type uncharacterized transport system, periplasmic component